MASIMWRCSGQSGGEGRSFSSGHLEEELGCRYKVVRLTVAEQVKEPMLQVISVQVYSEAL